MISHFIETWNDWNWGKFLLLRHGPEDLARRSAVPGAEDSLLLAARKFGRDETFIIDLATGEGCAFTLDSVLDTSYTLNEKHQVWVCPMFEPFVCWLAEEHPELARGGGDITKLPPAVELSQAPRAMGGYRRARHRQIEMTEVHVFGEPYWVPKAMVTELERLGAESRQRRTEENARLLAAWEAEYGPLPEPPPDNVWVEVKP